MKFGAHVSAAGGLFNAPINAAAIGADTFQMFSRSPRGGAAPILTDELLKSFKSALRKTNIKDFFIHGPYFINLASNVPRIRQGSISILREELERGTRLGARGVMFHMGSAKDFGVEKSRLLAIEGIEKILQGYSGSCELLIENSAGAGQILGATFEEIGAILDGLSHRNVGVCLDTCHLFASGYDIRTSEALEETLREFQKFIGIKKLRVIHLNDSLIPLGGHKDRHADIGFGELGKKTFKLLVNHPKLKNLCAILETPGTKLDYKKSISLLKKL